jgi:hypothetical protein
MEKMIVKNMKVILCSRQNIKDFIEVNHYSKSINGCISDYCFKLMYNDTIIGAAFFGRMAMRNQYKKYSDNEEDVIELRRLCCIDDTPKNTESFFIGKMLRYLKLNTKIKKVVSYADQEHGHTGVIYKASNFKYVGMVKGAKVIILDGKSYHDKSIRTMYNGKLKPFAQRLKDALSNGTAYYKDTAGKHTYVYCLKSD